MAFKGMTASGALPDSPEALYPDLVRQAGAVPGLWTHQADVLRQYKAEHVETADLALELPTGTGKTIPGLLIAEWTRRVRTARVVYACPTKQLARQVAKTAGREGMPAVLLVGSHHEWSLADEGRYEAAEALAVVTYNTVFNSSPKLAEPDLLVFDDAHAGEQYIAEQYAVDLRRRDDAENYSKLLDVVSAGLDGMVVQRLRDDSPDPGAHHQVRLVVPLAHHGMTDALDSVLSSLPKPLSFRYSMIRDCLPSCLVYVSYGAVLVRPFIPPTSDNRLFAHARQRLYLSATLGDGGELERSFGRSGIARLALPPSAPSPRSGRRYFVFPGLTLGADPVRVAQEVVKFAGKALVLAPDGKTAASLAQALAQPGWPVLSVDDVKDGMEPFARSSNAICGLANRYDGLDLPGDDCRAVALEGTPDQDSLQERFLSQRVRAGAALAERVRTRIVQGAGRCTRGPTDWAVVLVLGPQLTKYLLRPEVRRALDPELQAEIEFGLTNSRDADVAEVMENARVFIGQDDDWREAGEPLIAEYRRAASRELPDGTDALAQAVDAEIDACALAAKSRWADASRRAQDAARELGKGGDATRTYRAFWLYLAGMWADQASRSDNDPGLYQTARALVAQAEDAAKPATWTRDLPPLANTEVAELAPEDSTAVATVAQRLHDGVAAGKHDNATEAMLNGLAQSNPSLYEPALTQLGTLLGADSRKPPGSGRCDATWCWGNDLWLALEAKSDHAPAGVVPHKDVRQANDQLRLLAADRGLKHVPLGSATIIVSPRPAVDGTGAKGAESHVHLVDPELVLLLAEDTKTAWADLLAGRAGKDMRGLRDMVNSTFLSHGLLPTQVRERLTEQPVSTH